MDTLYLFPPDDNPSNNSALPKKKRKSPNLSPEARARIAAASSSKKGKKLSEEHKRKLSEAKKGKPSNRKGAELSEETRQKISEANKRRPSMSQETRDKMSKSQTGRVGPWKDRPIPQEVRAKMYATRAQNGTGKHTEETKKRLSQAHTGKKLSPEHRAKISENNKGNQRLKKYWSQFTPEERLDKLQNWIRAPKNFVSNTIEMAVALELDKRGIVYTRQMRIGRYHVDFYIPAILLVIECDGCYWHSCLKCELNNDLEKREYDRIRSEYIVQKGYAIAHIWEHEIRNDVISAVSKALGNLDTA